MVTLPNFPVEAVPQAGVAGWVGLIQPFDTPFVAGQHLRDIVLYQQSLLLRLLSQIVFNRMRITPI
jgi:hypothetical protein